MKKISVFFFRIGKCSDGFGFSRTPESGDVVVVFAVGGSVSSPPVVPLRGRKKGMYLLYPADGRCFFHCFFSLALTFVHAVHRFRRVEKFGRFFLPFSSPRHITHTPPLFSYKNCDRPSPPLPPYYYCGSTLVKLLS